MSRHSVTDNQPMIGGKRGGEGKKGGKKEGEKEEEKRRGWRDGGMFSQLRKFVVFGNYVWIGRIVLLPIQMFPRKEGWGFWPGAVYIVSVWV